ncbi:MAG: nucleotidyltransferase domain-containing protein [Candidatus Micrarchaeia archaeon]
MGKKELESFIMRANKQFPLEFAALFGSRARGAELKSSDYDVLLVSPSFSGMGIFQRMELALALWEGSGSVEPVCFTPEEFESAMGSYNTIAWEAAKDGIPLFGKEKFMRYRRIFQKAVENGSLISGKSIKFLKAPEAILASLG